MATPLRLLLVEDVEDDAVLLLRELRRGGYEVACRRVETPEEFSAALLTETWDLVIADYSLPRFSAPGALAIFKQSRIDIPFIVVSGRVGEETAVAAMKAGAHDYVMKASLVRLPAAIARELEEAQVRRERKLAAEALRVAKEAAEAASRAKSTFLANMSHEIRTPLNAVIGMTELVLKSQLSAQQREFLMTVKDSGEALLAVINDILDFSKIEADKLVLDHSTFNLRESLGDTMKSFAIRVHERGLELTCFIHPEVPQMVVGDYSRLRQIVTNLVGNAVKFTDRGEIDLEVTQESRSQRDVVLHFTVSDTGVGIPEEKRSTIFEMFEQADSSTKRRHGGTGLGLAIAARLVALMDGRIWLESELGRGSRFHFMVRLGLAEGEPPEPLSLEPGCLHGVRALVVDDNVTNRHILEETLQSWRMIPATAASAEEALDLLRRASEAREPYLLAVTDAHMPRIDGFMLAERIKQDPAISNTVIMMLTSGDRPEDIARCDQLGIAAYLLKPVKQSELLEAIELALGITVPREELLRSAAQQPFHVPSLRVLLAEDSLVNQKLAVALLEGQGHTVTLANNGKEAVAATDAQKFDLALMDVQMPEMDGLEATAHIRAREQQTGTHLPIIAMTAHALKGDRERCLGAGMDDYVAKPIRAEELFETIDAIFRDRKPDSATDLAVPQDVVNWTKVLQTAQGNRKVLKSMTEAALEEIPHLMTAIRQAVTIGDHAKLRFAAHTLKGSVRYFGASQVCSHAAKLEGMGQRGNLAEAEAIVVALDKELARVTAVLSDYLREPG
jgi:signal transduction histidine kinase/HPt (histidine-containing phosphotransfer) domain-containing protein